MRTLVKNFEQNSRFMCSKQPYTVLPKFLPKGFKNRTSSDLANPTVINSANVDMYVFWCAYFDGCGNSGGEVNETYLAYNFFGQWINENDLLREGLMSIKMGGEWGNEGLGGGGRSNDA